MDSPLQMEYVFVLVYTARYPELFLIKHVLLRIPTYMLAKETGGESVMLSLANNTYDRGETARLGPALRLI